MITRPSLAQLAAHVSTSMIARAPFGLQRLLPRFPPGSVYIVLALAGSLVAAPQPNDEVLRAQLFLDGSAFKPGAIDGKWGEFMRKALTRYVEAEGNGDANFGEKAPPKFDLPFDQDKPLLTSYTLTEEDKKFLGTVPESHAEQAKAESLPYESSLELVGEKFHTRRDFLKEINPNFDWENAKPGDTVQVPNVATPFDVQAAIDLKKQTGEAEKNNNLKTEDQKPENERFSLVVDVKEKIMEVKQGGELVGSYPITPGSKSLPAPIGEWFVKGFSWMPTFRWDEAILHGSERSNDFYQLPSGPNNPVGIIWMELNHKGSGIHGTEAPETIGRTTSHGCIRLSNWNALDLGKKVLPGVHVTIR
ncbi:MAG: L,D-transpeptidase [Verrucomicrobiota bacterium]|nr:L,D-transpeptidase [Verrucomicrobiota bacterium]